MKQYLISYRSSAHRHLSQSCKRLCCKSSRGRLTCRTVKWSPDFRYSWTYFLYTGTNRNKKSSRSSLVMARLPLSKEVVYCFGKSSNRRKTERIFTIILFMKQLIHALSALTLSFPMTWNALGSANHIKNVQTRTGNFIELIFRTPVRLCSPSWVLDNPQNLTNYRKVPRNFSPAQDFSMTEDQVIDFAMRYWIPFFFDPNTGKVIVKMPKDSYVAIWPHTDLVFTTPKKADMCTRKHMLFLI